MTGAFLVLPRSLHEWMFDWSFSSPSDEDEEQDEGEKADSSCRRKEPRVRITSHGVLRTTRKNIPITAQIMILEGFRFFLVSPLASAALTTCAIDRAPTMANSLRFARDIVLHGNQYNNELKYLFPA
jgi:hypothetical protein